MNKYQRLAITVAIIDLIVMVLFPPFVERSLARHALPTFDGFYFLLTEIGNRSIDTSLLSLEIFWIAANALSAWLALADRHDNTAESRHMLGLGIFAAVNLAIVCLFPPFEQYNSLLRTTAPGFDSFYFILGDRSARPIFMPLFYLEIFFVMINVLALYLLFNAVQRTEIAEQERLNTTDRLIPPTEALTSPEQRQLAEQQRAERMATLGRKEDRRQHADPAYPGPERRTGHERRHLD